MPMPVMILGALIAATVTAVFVGGRFDDSTPARKRAVDAAYLVALVGALAAVFTVVGWIISWLYSSSEATDQELRHYQKAVAEQLHTHDKLTPLPGQLERLPRQDQAVSRKVRMDRDGSLVLCIVYTYDGPATATARCEPLPVRDA